MKPLAFNIDKEGGVNLKEGSPFGSFEYVRDMVSQALRDQNILNNGKKDYYAPYIMYTYLDRVLVCADSVYYEVPYSLSSVTKKIEFGKPVEVEQYYVPKEVTESELPYKDKIKKEVVDPKDKDKKVLPKDAVKSEIKESGITIDKEATQQDFVFETQLKEASYDDSTGEVVAILIEAGTNPHKKRHYPKTTIQEAAGGFKGLKMYINHPTAVEEKERPERDLRDWVSTITESWYEDGKAMARIAVHDSWLRERLTDPVARNHIGLSINAGGKVSEGKVNGQNVQIVEQIVMARKSGQASVDWVTEAGARGRVAKMIKEANKKEKKMELHEATLADIKKENPQLLKDLTESIRQDIRESEESQAKEKEVKSLKEENANLKKGQLLSSQNEKVNSWLKESKMPEPAKDRVRKQFSKEVVEDETKLKESFNQAVKEELDYLNKFSEKGKILTGSGEAQNSSTNLRESLEGSLEARMGIKEDTKKN